MVIVMAARGFWGVGRVPSADGSLASVVVAVAA